jgi:hypothetical protein
VFGKTFLIFLVSFYSKKSTNIQKKKGFFGVLHTAKSLKIKKKNLLKKNKIYNMLYFFNMHLGFNNQFNKSMIILLIFQ